MPAAPDVLVVGEIVVVPAARLVRVGGHAIALTSIEFAILEHLAREAGRIVSRDALMIGVCGREASPLDRALDVHISHLRRKLHRCGSQIVTVRSVGYLLASVASELPSRNDSTCSRSSF
jgi:two-component system, OmpR family, response regulator CpxR